jgi:hypothetical protein
MWAAVLVLALMAGLGGVLAGALYALCRGLCERPRIPDPDTVFLLSDID